MTGRLKPWQQAAIAIGVLAGLALAVLMTLWLAGALFFLLHKSLPHHVGPGIWLTYWRYYGHDPVQRRLLLLVNGYTPLPNLLHRLDEAHAVEASVDRLLNLGLLRTNEEAFAPRESSWPRIHDDGTGRKAA